MVIEVFHTPDSTDEQIEAKNKAVLKADLLKRISRKKQKPSPIVIEDDKKYYESFDNDEFGEGTPK